VPGAPCAGRRPGAGRTALRACAPGGNGAAGHRGLPVRAEADLYAEERYTHADGTLTVIREYRADGTFHIMSDRGEIELIDNAQNPLAPDPVSVVRLP